MRLVARRFSPAAHLEMARPYTVFYPALSGVAGLELATAGAADFSRVALTGGVTMLGWIAGLYAGDYYDRHLDAKAKPSRPLPSGRVSPREAFGTMLGLIAVGYVGALWLGAVSLAIAVLATALAILYSKTFKARGLLGNLDRGLLGACAVVFGAVAGREVREPAVWVLALLLFFQDSASNLVGALRDVTGDRECGYRTFPATHGLRIGVHTAGALALLAALMTLVLIVALRPSFVSASLFAVSLTMTLGVYGRLWSRRRSLQRRQALGAHKYLVVQRLLLVGAAIANDMPVLPVAMLLGFALALTLLSQHALRDRYELEAAPSR